MSQYSIMPRILYRQKVPKKPIELSLVNDDVVRVKTYRMQPSDLKRLKQRCDIKDRKNI